MDPTSKEILQNIQNVQIDTTTNKEDALFAGQQNAPQEFITTNKSGELNLEPLAAETMQENVNAFQIINEQKLESEDPELKTVQKTQQTVKQMHTGGEPSAQAGLMMKKLAAGEVYSAETEQKETAHFETVVNKEKKKISHQVLADQAIEAQIEKDKQAMQNFAENQGKMTPEEKEQKLRTFAFPELLYTAIVEIEKTINMRGQRQDYREIASDVRTLRGLLDQHKDPSMIGDTSQREIGNLLYKIRSSVLQYKKKHWAVASFTAEGKRLALMTRILNVCDQALKSEETDDRTKLIALKQIAVDESDAGMKNKDTVKLFQDCADIYKKKQIVSGPVNHYSFQAMVFRSTTSCALMTNETTVQSEYAKQHVENYLLTGAGTLTTRCNWLYKPVYLNKEGEAQTEQDKENEAYNKELVENMGSMDIQKRTKFVMDILNRLFTVKITPEMFSLKYIQSHIPETIMYQQLAGTFENIVTKDVLNSAIFKSLPADIVKKVEIIESFSSRYTHACLSALSSFGVSQTEVVDKYASAKVTESQALKRLQNGEEITVKLIDEEMYEPPDVEGDIAPNAEEEQKKMVEKAEKRMKDGSIEINSNAIASDLLVSAYLYCKKMNEDETDNNRRLLNKKLDIEQMSVSMITQTELDELEKMLNGFPAYKGKEKDTSETDRSYEAKLKSLPPFNKNQARPELWEERVKILHDNYLQTVEMIKTIQRLRTFDYSTLSQGELEKMATILNGNTTEALERKEKLMEKLANQLVEDMTKICNGTYHENEPIIDYSGRPLNIKLY